MDFESGMCNNSNYKKWTMRNRTARIWILKVELIIITMIRNELWEIKLREYRFLIIIIITIILIVIIIIINELQEIELLEYRFLIIIRNEL